MAEKKSLPKPRHINVEPKGKYYQWVVGGIALLFVLSIVFSLLQIGIHIGELTLPYGVVLLVFLIAYILASIRFVQTDEIGGIMVLERPAKEVEAGIAFVPLWLTELHTFPLSVQQTQFPADPELISKRRDAEGLLPGQVRPIRITTHAPRKPKDSDDMLDVQMTIEVTFAVRWQIERGDFFNFFVNIPGDGWEAKKAEINRQMRDSGETDLVEEVSKYTLGEVLKNIETLNGGLATCLQENVGHWGILILEARMQTPDITHELNIALAGIPTARANAEATVTNAEAEKIRLTREGEGRAAAKRAELTAEGEGLIGAARALEMEGQDYLALQIARDTVGEGDLIIGLEGVEKVIGLGKTIMQAGGKK